jgi:hypothetical protein
VKRLTALEAKKDLMSGQFVEYAVGERYRDPSEEPPGDGGLLFIEGIPIYKIWYAPPLEVERVALAGTCTHIGLLSPAEFPGGLPFFLFRATTGEQLLCRAPLLATQEQVERWASADSNGFLFVLIERGNQIIRQNTILGIPPDFRTTLAGAWLSVQHPIDMHSAGPLLGKMTDQGIINAAASLWAFNPATQEFERKRPRAAAGAR